MFDVICIACVIMILFGVARAYTGYGIIDGMILIAVAVGIMVYFSDPNNLPTLESKSPQNVVSVQDTVQDDGCDCDKPNCYCVEPVEHPCED